MDIAALSASTSTDPAIGGARTDQSQEMSEFLRLLTAQIENQDPMEPLEANQFIEQLATINALEQQIQTNAYLEQMVDLLRDSS
ncbi:flagellar hook assembly protein FlgD [Parvularcula lutaonensis]|uniref:Basal-body rod modification protein FlgD n=1 Tax=Parvularcula lutaonensis TaxID=491923 RepID=A0ABV7M983_9PROT|nr:flagellar hook capping FlgD N-terminal domain-containing protein [Parvularcula lutaonensis]GGY43905.1 hypothetical protein GCM10007148_10920 [Parvularcula lutaonensis]